LIFGVEGQTLEAWAKDLTQVEKWNPHGLSLYDLEEYSQGIQRTDDTTRDTMIVMRDTWATEQGYRQYEVSNFARP
jgi:coproporphyrinogen III oxidase-like Fe-S oxidoreductase